MQLYLLMVLRRYWIERIEKAWEKRSVIWLAGVRRVGKTYPCCSLPEIEYVDCELPRTRRMMDDPEGFLGRHSQSLTGSSPASESIERDYNFSYFK